MKDLFKNIAISVWTKHRKKVIAVLLGFAFAGIASLTGIPLSEIQDAAKEAANKPAPAVVQPAVEAPLSNLPAPGNVNAQPAQK